VRDEYQALQQALPMHKPPMNRNVFGVKRKHFEAERKITTTVPSNNVAVPKARAVPNTPPMEELRKLMSVPSVVSIHHKPIARGAEGSRRNKIDDKGASLSNLNKLHREFANIENINDTLDNSDRPSHAILSSLRIEKIMYRKGRLACDQVQYLQSVDASMRICRTVT
jgi:hypothetical protein